MTSLILLSDFVETQIEIWRPVAGFPHYDISNKGRLRSYWKRTGNGRFGHPVVAYVSDTPKMLGPWKPNKISDYHEVYLHHNGKGKSQPLHRLVAKAFIPNPLNLRDVNHLNGNKLDNRAFNLEWASPKRNHEHAAALGLHAHGEGHGRAVLTEDLVRNIRALAASGIPFRAIARQKKVHQRTIQRVVRRAHWRHVT